MVSCSSAVAPCKYPPLQPECACLANESSPDLATGGKADEQPDAVTLATSPSLLSAIHVEGPIYLYRLVPFPPPPLGFPLPMVHQLGPGLCRVLYYTPTITLPPPPRRSHTLSKAHIRGCPLYLPSIPPFVPSLLSLSFYLSALFTDLKSPLAS